MSIKLQVEPYCSNCPNFAVEVEKTALNGFDDVLYHETTIKCRNAAQCQRMMEFLKKQSWDEFGHSIFK